MTGVDWELKKAVRESNTKSKIRFCMQRAIQLPNTQRRLESEDSDHLTEHVVSLYFSFFLSFICDSHASKIKRK